MDIKQEDFGGQRYFLTGMKYFSQFNKKPYMMAFDFGSCCIQNH